MRAEISLTVLESNAGVVQHNLPPPGESMARAGASRTHVYVSTTDGLHTFDANGQNNLFTLPWVWGSFASGDRAGRSRLRDGA